MTHKLIHSRVRVEGGWITRWVCEQCSREYEYGPSGYYKVIDKGEQLAKHIGSAGTDGMGFIIRGIDSDEPVPPQFDDFFDGLKGSM